MFRQVVGIPSKAICHVAPPSSLIAPLMSVYAILILPGLVFDMYRSHDVVTSSPTERHFAPSLREPVSANSVYTAAQLVPALNVASARPISVQSAIFGLVRQIVNPMAAPPQPQL